MIIRAVIEFNDKGYMIHAENFAGAFSRGKTKEEALGKLCVEVEQYLLWSLVAKEINDFTIEVVQQEKSEAEVSEADSTVIFDSERTPLTMHEYRQTKELVIKSARNFDELYNSIPDKNKTTISARQTFYGSVPRTANEMLAHVNEVTKSYVSGLVVVEDGMDIYADRIAVFDQIERLPNYLNNNVYTGSYNELWSIKKVMRRFIWHDRIHAKAMYRMAVRIWGDIIANPFYFAKRKSTKRGELE